MVGEILAFCVLAGLPFAIIVWMNGLFGVRGGIIAALSIIAVLVFLWFLSEAIPEIGLVNIILLPLSGLGTFLGFAYVINRSGKR